MKIITSLTLNLGTYSRKRSSTYSISLLPVMVQFLMFIVWPQHGCSSLCNATHLSPAVSEASLSSPGWGSDVSAKILSICCSISRGNSSRPS